jgi:hypothetical protein
MRNNSIIFTVAKARLFLVRMMLLIGAALLTGCIPSLASISQPPPPPTTSSVAPSIILEPYAAPENSSVTVRGLGWEPGSNIVIYMVVTEGQYAIASAQTDAAGNFTTDYFVPSNLKYGVVTILAQANNSQATAQTLFNIEEIPQSPTPIPVPSLAIPAAVSTPVPRPPTSPPSPYVIVAANTLNIRSGPGTVYPVIGQALKNQILEAVGRHNNWWQIRFPGTLNTFGWVSDAYVIAQNTNAVPIVAAPPPPTPVVQPTFTPQPTYTPNPTYTPGPPAPIYVECLPEQWSDCGGDPPHLYCHPEYVAQCQSDGRWGQCVWAPGVCRDEDEDD